MSINHRSSFPIKEKIDLINNSNNIRLSRGKDSKEVFRSTVSHVISIKKIINLSGLFFQIFSFYRV